MRTGNRERRADFVKSHHSWRDRIWSHSPYGLREPKRGCSVGSSDLVSCMTSYINTRNMKIDMQTEASKERGSRSVSVASPRRILWMFGILEWGVYRVRLQVQQDICIPEKEDRFKNINPTSSKMTAKQKILSLTSCEF